MVYGAVAQVSNSIIWDNSGDQIFNYGNTLSMTYSDSQVWPGTGNFRWTRSSPTRPRMTTT